MRFDHLTRLRRDAQAQGFRAHGFGRSRSDNPYAEPSKLIRDEVRHLAREHWWIGWDRADGGAPNAHAPF